MKQKELVSIIIPTYNSIKTISCCLDSVFYQTYDKLEIIVVDGISTDGTYEYLLSISQKIKLFQLAKRGVSRQRNYGIDNSSGDYIFFLDSDDYISNDCIEKLVYSIGNNSIAIPKICLFYNEDEIPQNVIPIDLKLYQEANKHIDFFCGGHSSCLLGPVKLYRKKTIGNIRFSETISYAEDLLFNYSIYHENTPTYVCVDNAFYYYRKYKGLNPASKRLSKNVLLFFNVLLGIYKETKSDGLVSIIDDNYRLFFKTHKKKNFILFKTKMFLVFHKKGIRERIKILTNHI